MTTALTVTGGKSLSTKEQEEATGIKGSSFFPFIQLLQPQSRAVDKENAPGTMLMKSGGKDKNPLNLGESFECFVISVRGKAAFWEGDVPEVHYHTADRPQSDRYKEIAAKAKESFGRENPYKAQLEVLVFIPETGTYAVVTGQSIKVIVSIEKNISPYCADENTPGSAVRLFAEEEVNSKGRYYVLDCRPLEQEEYEVWKNHPSDEDYIESLKLFNNPPAKRTEEDVEGAEKAETTGRKR